MRPQKRKYAGLLEKPLMFCIIVASPKLTMDVPLLVKCAALHSTILNVKAELDLFIPAYMSRVCDSNIS